MGGEEKLEKEVLLVLWEHISFRTSLLAFWQLPILNSIERRSLHNIRLRWQCVSLSICFGRPLISVNKTWVTDKNQQNYSWLRKTTVLVYSGFYILPPREQKFHRFYAFWGGPAQSLGQMKEEDLHIVLSDFPSCLFSSKNKNIAALHFLGKPAYSQAGVSVYPSQISVLFGCSAFTKPSFRSFSNRQYLSQWFLCIPVCIHRFLKFLF